MTVVAFAFAVVAALAWLLRTARSTDPVADRAVQLAWQLAALSFLSAPEALVGEDGSLVFRAVVGGSAALALVVRLALLGRSASIALPLWLGAYAIVLALAAGFSSSPDIAALRGLRAVALFVVFVQAGVVLDRSVLRRLLFELSCGLAVVVALGPLVAGGDAFHPLQAPIIRWALQAPIVGSGPHVVAAIGFALILATLWCWLDGDRPVVWSRRWLLAVALPGATGVFLVLAAQKRAFWSALLVVAVTWLALCHRRWLLPALAAIGVAAVALLAVGPARDLWDREQSRPQVDNIASVRSAIFEASIDRFVERPLIGDGLGVGNRDLLIDVGQPGRTWASHSEIGAALAATGLVGLIVVAWGHLVGWSAALAAWRNEADPLPLVVTVGTLALVPFWRVLQEPLALGLAYYAIVLPLHPWRRVGPGEPVDAGRHDEARR